MLRQPGDALTTVISAVIVTSSKRAGHGAGIGAESAEDRGAAEHYGSDRGEQIRVADADIALPVHAEQQHAGEPRREAADAVAPQSW